jgi:serpin B
MSMLSRRCALQLGMSALAALAAQNALGGAAPGARGDAPAQSSLRPFSLSLFTKLSEAQPEENIFISPLSIVEAVGMLQAGARGDTAAEIASAIGIPQNQLPDVIASINQILLGKDRPYTVSLANAVWVQQTYPLKADYQKLLETKYAAEGANCDFIARSEQERQRINQWVSQKTKDKIKDLLPSSSISPLTRLVVTNAIYFNAEWERAFDPDRTKEENFTLDAGEFMVPVSLMNAQFSNLSYFEDDTLQAIDLPYRGNTASMLVLLPRKGAASELAKSITPQKLAAITSGLRSASVTVWLPKFKLETSYDLIPPLQSLGMKRAFDASAADFTGMSEGAKSEGLHVSTVVHKAYLDVNEQRTEAAGATGAAVALSAVPTRPVVFRADHPFLFAIRDRKSGELLFIGRYSNPS